MAGETLQHLLGDVLAAVNEYVAADEAAVNSSDGEVALRRAFQMSMALDSLVDRAAIEFGKSKSTVREDLACECKWPNGVERPGCSERIRSVADAYRHFKLDRPSSAIESAADVIFFGAGYGLDGWGVGKCGGSETLVRDKDDNLWKLLGDVPCVVFGWARLLLRYGAQMPGQTHVISNIEIAI